MAYQNLITAIEDRIALVTINRPNVLNALNCLVMAELESLFKSLAQEPDLCGVILTGAGPKAFVAGADIKEIHELDPISAYKFARYGQSVLDLIENFEVPVIAAVNGFALGGGCELSMACHIRIASKNAKFGQPEVKLGIIPGYGGTQRLTRLVGRSIALELLLSGKMIEAEEAKRIGLVNEVVEPDQLIPACRNLLSEIRKNGPLAVRLALEATRRGLNMNLSEGQSYEANLFALASATGDMKEGTAAFLEKRKPEFKGC